MHRKLLGRWVSAMALTMIVAIYPLFVSAETFPRYEKIHPNVAFWVDIYSKYTTTQAIVHDAKNLDIIYNVIDLEGPDTIQARKINRRRMKQAKSRYQKILLRLADNPDHRNASTQKIAKMFGAQSTSKTYRAAAGRVRCQIGQRDRFRAGLIRSGAYLKKIREIFAANGLPEALAYLPHVESSFNYKAYSKFGAAGIWQFTRSTGKRFMKVGYVLDERRDPIRSTHSAAALLKENLEKLGSWPLAITAYNHGAAGMARAKAKYGIYPVIFEKYRSRTFKFASRNFYSEFLAACQVASDYQSYFGELTLDRPLLTRPVVLDGYIGLEKLCQHYDLPIGVARSLNPALRPPVFNGQKYVPKGYAFRLPAKTAATSQMAPIPSSFYDSRQKPSRFYTVQKGDTAGRIARIQGVRLSDLILANNLSRRATIYPKQTLRIPRPDESIPRIAKDSLQKTKPISIAKNTVSPPPQVDHREKHPQETIYPQAVQASAILSSPLTDRRSALGQPRQETDKEIPSREIVTADVQFEKLDHTPSLTVGTLRVEVEETLGHFAEWAQIRTQRIRRLNGLPFGKKLRLHQKVKIPLGKVTHQAFEQARYEYHKRLQEDFFSVYLIGEMRHYSVQGGDNLWALSLDKFDVPMWLLISCNPEVDFAALRLKQALKIPVIEKRERADVSLP